jgi:type IV secretion system protein VirB5
MEKKKERSQNIGSPYLLARKEWNERYGSYIAQARSWRNTAFVALLIAVIAVSGVIYLASQNKLIPYVVEVNGEGKTVQVYQSEKMQPLDERVLKAQLGQFVQDIRSVSADIAVQRRAVKRAYAHLSADMPAYTATNDWFRKNNPFERATEETVVTEIRQILPLSDNTWRIEWVEKPRTRNGEALPVVSRTATATIVASGEINPENILYNPTGLYIKEFDWSRNFNTNETETIQ